MELSFPIFLLPLQYQEPMETPGDCRTTRTDSTLMNMQHNSFSRTLKVPDYQIRVQIPFIFPRMKIRLQFTVCIMRHALGRICLIWAERLFPSFGVIQYLTKEVRKVKCHAVDKGTICYSFRKRPTLIHSASYEHICLFRQIWFPVCLRNNFPIDGLMRLGFKASVCTLLTHFEGIAFHHNRPVSTKSTLLYLVSRILLRPLKVEISCL